jgi:hypothetical protein
MRWSAQSHWKVFNALARIFGIMFCVAGAVFALSAHDAVGYGVAFFCIAVGVPFLLVRPYRPDLATNAAASRARWWTGNPNKTE